MSNKVVLLYYVLIGGSLRRYIVETTFDSISGSTPAEEERNTHEKLFQHFDYLRGKGQILDIEQLDATVAIGD